jgi:hypothetical protein
MRRLFIEGTDRGFWGYLQRSAGRLPEAPLHGVLKWVLEQLNFGNFKTEQDSRGDVVSMIIGRGAAVEQASSEEEVEAQAKRRIMAVDFAGVAAEARESGIQPHLVQLSKRISQEITPWGSRNTEFHYAFELTKVLGRLNKKTFGLDAPATAGRAPESAVAYLRESTRCWLYGFHGASVALSRACLEEALKARLRRNEQLESLIAEASQVGILDTCMVEVAHTIRKTANRFLHGKSITERESRETLDATRSIVEQVFA